MEARAQVSPGHLSVGDVIDAWAKRTPEAIFLVDPNSARQITYAELRQSAASVAGYLHEQGIEPGQSVAYAMPNGIDTALVFLGMLYGGYLATAVNLIAGKDTFTYILEHCEARLVLLHKDIHALLESALPGIANPPRLVEVTEDLLTTSVIGDKPRPTPQSDGLLIYTSGTTGQPKGVVLSQQNLLAGGENTATAHRLITSDRALCVLPLYHINALCVTLMAPLVSGGSVVMPHQFSVSDFWPCIERTHCTWASVVPTQITYLLRQSTTENSWRKPPQLRFIRSASAPLSPSIHREFEKRFSLALIETMGLTETAAQILSNSLSAQEHKVGSPGRAVGNEIIIADDKQCEVRRGTEGEVLVRGTNVMQRYLKNPEATRETLTPSGWLRTGDLGQMDTDGYVFITGRLKELIIKGGENIAPREVDDALYSHQDIIEAAAFACPCSNYGQRVEAGVVLAENSDLTEADLLRLCRDKLGTFKAPDHIHFLDELPKGPSGKIQRIKLATLVQVLNQGKER